MLRRKSERRKLVGQLVEEFQWVQLLVILNNFDLLELYRKRVYLAITGSFWLYTQYIYL